MGKSITNFIGFQSVWLACILGAAGGYPWVGVIFTLTALSLHVALVPGADARELALILAAGLLGYAVDSALVLGGLLTFPETTRLGGPSPLWMVFLWMGFAATLRHSLRWLSGKYALGALLGAAFGPLAYWAGARLGAVALAPPTLTLIAVGVAWAVMLPVLLWLSMKLYKVMNGAAPALAEKGPAMTELQVILLGWLAVAIVMAVFWYVQLTRSNAGIVDVVWAFSTAALALWLLFAAGDGEAGRHLLLAALIGSWGVRLGTHLLGRLRHDGEDGRYVYLKQVFGARLKPAMFAFFQIQALWAVMFALPVWAAGQAQREFYDWLDILGVLIWITAVAGETLADRQLAAFKANPATRGQVCDIGLWRYSRHPNYFFEWTHWWAYMLIGYASGWWWVTVLGVVVMYVFLTRVTGLPYTESQSLRSRGDDYRLYQRRTSAFFPRPPRTEC